MTPRPIRKWKSFWLGLLVLAFLLSSWIQSMNRLDTLRFAIGVDSWEVHCTMGKILALRYSDSTTGRGLHSISFVSDPGGGTNRQVPPAFDTFRFEGFPHVEGWMISYWFLILFLLTPWLTFLTRRWLRIKRQATAIADPQPHTTT